MIGGKKTQHRDSELVLPMMVSYLEGKRKPQVLDWKKGHLYRSEVSWLGPDLTKGRKGLALSYSRRLIAAKDICKEHSNSR